MQTIETAERVLKENYLPLLRNQLGVAPSAFLAKIKKVPAKSDKIVAGFPAGLSGGFGFGKEGAATPFSGPVPLERFEERTKDMYVDIEISAKSIELGGSAGSMANLLDTEVKGGYETGKWNLGRALFMNGTGILTTISALGTAGNTITVASTKYLKEGLIIDIYATGGTTPVTGGAKRRIKSIDRANKTITIDGDAQTFAAGFITVQNSYNREITGLGAIFDSSITTLYGLTKANHPYILPVEIDGGGDIDDGTITRALRQAKDDKNSAIDTMLCGNEAYDNYVNYLRVNNIRVEDMSHTIQGGFKAIKFLFGDKEIDIINESFVPDKEMWGVDSTVCEFPQTDWKFATLQGGGIFNLMEGKSVYRALLVNYGNLLCKNPGGCVRIYNCA